MVALDVPEGTRVEAGHVLARLDDAEARAALSVASARLENARARLARQAPLHAQGVASEQALDDAQSEVRAAEGATRRRARGSTSTRFARRSRACSGCGR